MCDRDLVGRGSSSEAQARMEGDPWPHPNSSSSSSSNNSNNKPSHSSHSSLSSQAAPHRLRGTRWQASHPHSLACLRPSLQVHHPGPCFGNGVLSRNRPRPNCHGSLAIHSQALQTECTCNIVVQWVTMQYQFVFVSLDLWVNSSTLITMAIGSGSVSR